MARREATGAARTDGAREPLAWRELAAAATPEALERTIEEVASGIADEDVAEVLAFLASRASASTLGELLGSYEAEAMLREGLGAAARRDVLGSLRQYVRTARPPLWRWTPRSPVSPPARPPHEPKALERWIARADLAEALAEPAAVVLPLLARAAQPTLGMAKVKDLLDRRAPSRGAPSGELRDAALAYLFYRAFRGEQARHREKAWALRPATGPLRTVSARLKEALRSFENEPDARGPVRLAGGEKVRVRPDPPTLEVSFEDRRNAATVAVELAGYESAPLTCVLSTAEGEHKGVPANEPDLRRSPQLRALLEWALDAVHDPEHGLHEAVRSVLGQPTWTRFLEALGEALQQERSPADRRSEERLVFRLGEGEDGFPELRPAVQKRLKSGRWSSGSVVPARRLMERPELVTDDDLPVVDALLAAELAADQRPGALVAVRERRARALRALAGHSRVFDATGKEPLRVRRVVPALALVPAEESDDAVRVALRLGDEVVDLTPFEDGQGPSLLMARDERGYVLAEVAEGTRAALAAVARFPSGVPVEGQDRLVGLAARLQPDVQLQLPARLRGEPRSPDERLVVRLVPEEAGLRGALCVRPVPAGATWPAGEGPILAFGAEAGARVHAHRDLEAETQRADALLEELGLRGGRAPNGGPGFRVAGLERGLELLERLEARAAGGELEVEQPERGAWELGRTAGTGDLRVRVRRAADWLGIGGELEVDGERIPLAALLEAVRERRRYVRLGPGRFARLADDLRAQLQDAAERLGAERGGEDELRAGLGEVEAVEAFAEAAGKVEREASFSDLLKRARAAPELDVALPESFAGELRDYQREGYEWLSRLAHWGAGAVLADEMGLGKTIQTLALLARRASEGPALVVAPTSVGPNWMAEAARVTPELRARAYRGPKRAALREDLGPGDVLVTSYDVLARDGDVLAEVPLGTLVLDEAQAVKNVRTRRAQAAAGLQAGYRVALTGTPLENHLGELYSLYRIVAPGFLGSWPSFRRRYAIPIERDGDDASRVRLAKRLRPFLLRRTKKAVAPELPPRTDVVQPIE
ncbi:MAG: SNF2-related protein, partial [Myxococcota bacterium]